MADVPSPVDHQWLSVHVFYASNANPMLVECVQPLVDRLRADGLITRYFFIKYWMEGPHVRLRVLPAPGVDPELVRTEVDTAVAEFLRRRPALYETDTEGLGDLYKQMYLAEYGQERWDAEYGDGVMPFRPNNSFAHIPYEREFGRYGGPAGIEVAEWHFEKSSDVVLDLLATTNVHVRPVLLGLSAQLSMMMCAVFFGDEHRISDFLDDYRRFWEVSYQEPSDEYHGSFDNSYRRMSSSLRDRLAALRRSAADDTVTSTLGIEGRWLAHCRELRHRVVELVESGQVWFQRGGGEPTPATDLDAAMSVLLSSYIHMTNNRLGVSILDEIYLSYLMRNALLDELKPAGA